MWLARKGRQVTAVDFSEVGLDTARRIAEHAGVSIDLVCADATQPSEGDYAAAAVAPGGTLVIVGHHLSNIAEGYEGPQDPSVLFTPADVVADLDGTGLTVVRADEAHRHVATDDGERRAIDVLARAERVA